METVQVIISTALKDEIATACVWDAYNGTLLARYRGGGYCSPHGLCSSGGYVLSCIKSKPMLNLWQFNKQHCENKRLVAPGKVSTVAFSTDSYHIALAIDEKVYLYQTSSGKILGVGSRHFQPITVIKFCDDSSLLCCGGEDGLVTVWNLSEFCVTDKNPEPFLTFSEHTLPVSDLKFSSGNLRSWIISVSIDRTCKVYDLISGKVVLSIVFEQRLSSVALSPVEMEIFVGNSEGTIHEFSLTSPPRMLEYHVLQNEKSPIFSGHEKAVNCLVCTVDCCHLISGSDDESIKIWHISSRQCLRTIPQKGPVTNILHLLLPKSVFQHDYKPTAYIHDFINPANVDEDEEPSFEIMVSENLLPPVTFEPTLNFDSNAKNVESLNENINRLKSINNAMYKFAVDNIFSKKPVLDNNITSAGHVTLEKKPKKKKLKKNSR